MSNIYPSWWNQTVTIYNKYESSNRQVTWYKHTVSGCFWKFVGAKVTVGETTLETDVTVCRIPKQANFKENYLWVNETDKSSYLTLSIGDIIVRGEVTDTINEYQSGSRSSDLLNKYKKQGCITVESAAVNVDGGRHNEHYLVKGI